MKFSIIVALLSLSTVFIKNVDANDYFRTVNGQCIPCCSFNESQNSTIDQYSGQQYRVVLESNTQSENRKNDVRINAVVLNSTAAQERVQYRKNSCDQPVEKFNVTFRSTRKKGIYAAFFPALLRATTTQSINSQILYLWSQVIPENKLSVRAIIENGVCPVAYIDGDGIEMLNRSSIDYGNHTETVCELVVEINVKNISVDNKQVPVLSEKIRKVVFIGDTGCRLNGIEQQECHLAASWPLKENLKSIALHQPDLIVHVGDYHYREKKCTNLEKCGDLFGYNKEVWYADWFSPAQEILLQSPFLFVRGNHENCERAHIGWFKYLDAYPFSEICEHFVPSWSLDIGIMKFAVFDTSFGEDTFTTQEISDDFERQFNKLLTKDDSDKPTWLLTHRPFWRYPLKEKHVGNWTQIEELGDKFLSTNITAIISGHIHLAQILLMNNVPDQILVGNGGALLYLQEEEPFHENVQLNYSNGQNYVAREVRNFFGFGFAILNLDDYEFSFHSQDNQKIYSSNLTKEFKFLININ